MTVAIGPVLFILASILLSAVLVLAAFGIILWVSQQPRRARDGSDGRIWEHDPTDIATRDGTSFVVPGK